MSQTTNTIGAQSFYDHHDLLDQIEYQRNKITSLSEDLAFWRDKYAQFLTFNSKQQTDELIADNSMLREYIFELESRVEQLIKSNASLIESFQASYLELRQRSTIPVESVTSEYLKQIDCIAEDKANLNATLSLSKHIGMQNEMRIEELQARIYELENCIVKDYWVLYN